MKDRILERIHGMFDVRQMGNTLRGLWAEAMVAELLSDAWKHTGNDWAAWDFERDDGLRLELKQSARQQTWGLSKNPTRFKIAAAKGHYPDGVTYEENTSGRRLAEIYVFACHDGNDQRDVSEWVFFVVRSDQLPHGQKSIGLNAVRKMAAQTGAASLGSRIDRVALELKK